MASNPNALLKDKEIMVAGNPGIMMMLQPTDDAFKVSLHISAVDALLDIQGRRQQKTSLPDAIIFQDEGNDVLELIRRIKGHHDSKVREIGVVLLTNRPDECKTLEPLGAVLAPLHPAGGQYPNYAKLAAQSIEQGRSLK